MLLPGGSLGGGSSVVAESGVSPMVGESWLSSAPVDDEFCTGGLDAAVVGELVAVELFKLRHAIHSASVVLLWQHVSTVQKPAMVGS